jgi:drug/metabolite transporter (DMT)-like permease
VASIVAASEVVFGALVGYFFFGEKLQGWQFLGAVLVMAGVGLVALKGDAKADEGQGKKDQ